MGKSRLGNAVGLFMILWVALVLGVTGCPKSPEGVARDSIAAARGIITTAQSQYKAACIADPQYSHCVTINKLVAGQNLAIDALEAYCAGPDWGTVGAVCSPHAELEPKLREALKNLEQEKTDVKGLIK